MDSNYSLEAAGNELRQIATKIEDLRFKQKRVIPLSEIGETIKERRNTLNLSQLKLAEMAGVNKQLIIKAEAGDLNIVLSNLIKILELLGIKLCLT